MKTILIFSGGLDSTTLLWHLRDAGHDVQALAVDYGQRHGPRELAAAQALAALARVPLRVLNLRSLVEFFGTNRITDSQQPVPEGPYEPATMALTTVPNRNMILLAVALSWAASGNTDSEADAVAFGAHGGEYTPYPDCQPGFAAAMDAAAKLCHHRPLRVLAPFVTWSKAEIVRRGAALAVPFERTYSCYRGLARHCGRCGTCQDRRTAFQLAQIPDPTEYESEALPLK